jgi:thiol-disulfide isomerase/thioredoxin
MRLAIAAISFTLLLPYNGAAEPATAIDLDTAADWTLTSADGAPVTLGEAVVEQPVILFFWATWCPYCKALMPHLQSVRLEHGERVKVLALHFRDDEGDPVGFMRAAGYDFTLLENSEDVAKLYKVWGTPGVIIVDRDMKIRFNLYTLPKRDPPATGEPPGRSARAAFLAPYWAAEIRKTLRVVLDEGTE